MMEKTIRNYGKVYRKALTFRSCRDIETKVAAYESRLREMYVSDNFRRAMHSCWLLRKTRTIKGVEMI